MAWPRGRNNGQRIIGARVVVVFDVLFWRLRWGSVRYGQCWCFGPFRWWLSAEYER